MNKELNAAEAVYGFVGWLTSREERTVMSAKDDCAPIAELIKRFCTENNLPEVSDQWPLNLIHPSGEVAVPNAVLAKWGAPAPAQDDSLTTAYMAGAHYVEKAAAAELRRQHAEIETLRAGYDAARLKIASLRERVQELEAQLAAVAAPKKWAPEEVADGGRGIRWVTNEGVHGRPTDHDVREYLERTPTANGCHCDDCKRFYAAASDVTAAPAQAGEYPPLVCDYCGALTPDPWHSSGMLHGKMSKHIHSCDSCAALATPTQKGSND